MKYGEDGMFVILSDVHLDNPSVLDKLEVMFEGYSDFAPLPVFVFMGNFTSKPLLSSFNGANDSISYFEDLANLICKFPKIASEGRFVFVPGPNDPGLTGVLPRGPIPNYFTGAVRSKVKHAFFASNPCRMRFFTKELVFFRDDLVSKMRRHTLRRALAPLGDRILIRRAEKEVKTASGILLPSDKAKDANEGTVVSVGPGVRDINGVLHAPTIQAGDSVLLPKYGGTEVEIGEEKLVLFREEDILGKFA
jgi:co-chaperonin GroES (HSP10)